MNEFELCSMKRLFFFRASWRQIFRTNIGLRLSWYVCLWGSVVGLNNPPNRSSHLAPFLVLIVFLGSYGGASMLSNRAGLSAGTVYPCFIPAGMLM